MRANTLMDMKSILPSWDATAAPRAYADARRSQDSQYD